MKYWNFSLYLSICSLGVLVVIFFLPDHYSVFIYNKTTIGCGRLFPVMFFIWVMALLAFAFNNVFVDSSYIYHNLHMSQVKKFLPSILGIPALSSFIWFLYKLINYNSVV